MLGEIVSIDVTHPRVGTCRACRGDRTVYPVKDSAGAWSWACKPCAPDAEVIK